MEYCRFTDEQLVKLIKAGNNDCLHTLINRYSNTIKYKAASLCDFSDYDDMVQEGIIALYSAVNVYNETLSSFSTFANLCIERSLITAYRKLFSKKQIPKYAKVSFENIDNLSDNTPESLIIEKEECELFTNRIRTLLSDFEYKVLCEYLVNNSYQVIADSLKTDKKSVNNAMMRLRKKIKAINQLLL